MITLVAFKNNATRRDIPLKPGTKMIIGRQPDADIRIPLNEISRHHCELNLNGSKATIKDLGSSNGTYVNDKKIEGETALKAGDRITVGPVLFVVQVDGVPAEINEDGDVPAKPAAKQPAPAAKPASAAPKPAPAKPAPAAPANPAAAKPAAAAPKSGPKTPIDSDDFDIDDLSDLDLGGLPDMDLDSDDLSDLLKDDEPPAKKGAASPPGKNVPKKK